MEIDKFLSRLDVVKQTSPTQWVARCPSHKDKYPSLSIGLSGDGKILINCFAGCTTESILAAINLTFRDLYPDNAPFRAAVATASKRLKPIDLKSLDETVLVIAKADLDSGKTLSIEDQARLELAMVRLGIRGAVA